MNMNYIKNHKCNGCKHKGEHQEMGFRSFGVCTKELNLIDSEKSYNAEKCPYNNAEEWFNGFLEILAKHTETHPNNIITSTKKV